MFYTTDQVAQLLGFKSETIRKKVRRGEIIAFKVRDKIRIPEEEVKKYLDNVIKTNSKINANKEEIIENLIAINKK